VFQNYILLTIKLDTLLSFYTSNNRVMFEKRKIHLSYVYDKNFHVRKFDAPRFHRKIKKINTVMIFMTEVDEKCYSI